jgi:hypothetical protein
LATFLREARGAELARLSPRVERGLSDCNPWIGLSDCNPWMSKMPKMGTKKKQAGRSIIMQQVRIEGISNITAETEKI